MLTRTAALVRVLTSATALAAGCAVVAGPTQPGQPRHDPVSVPASPAAPAALAPAALTPALVLPHSDPVTLTIPRISVTSPLLPLGLNADGTVEVPPVATPMQAGWYRFGPAPGDSGRAVILGHVDGSHSPGVFYRLRQLRPDDDIVIIRRDGRNAHFRVQRVDEVPKDRFPTEDVYGWSPRPELRLISCGGMFDRAAHSYRDNIIVSATYMPTNG